MTDTDPNIKSKKKKKREFDSFEVTDKVAIRII